MTEILTPEFEGTPEGEHEWKDSLTKGYNSLVASVAALTEEVAANTAALAAEEEAPGFEVEIQTTSSTIITPFTNEYPFGTVICEFTVNAASNSDTIFLFGDPDAPGTDNHLKYQTRIQTAGASNNNSSMAFSLTKDELGNGRVEITGAGAGAAPFTVNRWIIIRFRSE